MRRSYTFFLLLALAAMVIIPSSTGVKADGPKLPIGTQLEHFSLNDVSGKAMATKDNQGSKGTLYIFLSAQCPVVKAYIGRIQAIAKDYEAKGIKVIGINSNDTEINSKDKPTWIKDDTAENFPFPMLLDTGNKIADKWGASVTPEAYLFDASGKLVYRGAVDSSQKNEGNVRHYLRDALDSALASKDIAEKETNPFGCSIKRVKTAVK